MLFVRKIKIATTTRRAGAVRSKEPWHAVRVVAGAAACPAPAKLGRRFLSDEAPRLPLPMCSSPLHCQCTHKHFADRRACARRDVERTGLQGPRIGVERRTKHGRRATDGMHGTKWIG